MAADTGEYGTGPGNRPHTEIIGVTPFGRPAPHLAVAVARAGGTGVLDLGADRASGLAALADMRRWWTGPFGVRVPAGCRIRPADLPAAADTVLVDAPALRSDDSLDVAGFARGRRLLVEVVGPEEAAAVIPVARGFTGDVGLIARGGEAGGRGGDLTTFILLQRLLGDASVDVPVYAAGGVGPHTAAAAVAGGAAGVVLDVQLALVREADPPAEAVPAAGDGPGTGQEGPSAAALAARYKTAGGVVQAIREQIGAHLRAAVRAEPLAPRGDDASGRLYPVAQGPMTHVSDRSAFAGAVAQEGGLPFLALALMDGDQVAELLRETADRIGGLPWGVGVAAGAPAGFTPPDVRAAQLAAVRAARPPFALVAGGSPEEAASLEAAGIATYLDVPSPELLDRFLGEGVRKFVFGGREGGGPIGPRAAFPLWEAQLERLLALGGDAAGLSVMFAGGVHDERSAAMVAALAGPLAERGADVRVLMGTGYLFTTEAVATGAILPGYQDVALACDGTALLESSAGRVTRCARTPYVETFAETRRELEQVGTAGDEVGRRLEKLNLGRLRVAAKGLRRSSPVDAAGQRAAGLYALGEAAALRSATTGIAALHEQVTAGATAFLAARAAELGMAPRPAPRDGSGARRPRPADIAIIGIGCVFPGARHADGYWANIVAGTDSVTEVTRWDPDVHHDPSAEERTPSKWGGFIPDIPFDPDVYGIPPGTLGGIAPIQLLALEVASHALKDAGYADRPFDRSRTSVFFGADGGGELAAAYGTRAMLRSYLGEVPAELDERLPRPDADSFAGVLTNVIAGRIAHVLDLAGTGYTVDAAGAASLAALDAACKDLAAGVSDMALCGAADLGTGVQDYLLLAPALSPSGRSAAFDSAADGIVPGEGAACVVLKRLADAERDGDRVYAVVKSVAASSDGRSLGLTTPRADGQRLALERACERAGVSPASIGLVEANGTGAADEDRTELTALAAAFTGAAPGGVTLGSVKAQIGHTGRAAGLAGLIKTAYALHTGVLPGTLHLARPRPEWKRDGPFAFGGAARPWAVRPGDRYAGVSASGYGGTNFHAVLSGYDGAPEPVSGLAEWPAELFLIRAADRPAARAEIDRLLELAAGEPRLRDVARTAASLQGPVQAAFVATGPDDLRRKLSLAREFRPASDVHLPGAEPGQVAFLFPGQGSERPNMLADLFVAFPRLQRLLRLAGGRYAPAMFPPAAFTPDETGRHLTEVARVAPPALGIAGLAVHRLLTALGVHPDLAAGHGHGELVALCAAGVFDDTDMVEFCAARAESALSALSAPSAEGGGDPGAMAVVDASLHEAREALSGLSDVVIAGHDAPRQVAIAGTREGVDGALAALSAAGLDADRVPVPCALHSPLAATASADLRTDLLGRDLRSPAFPVWANATAAPYDSDPADLAATLAGQIAAPVRFVEQIEAMYDAGARTFVETGPGRVLTGLVGEILGDRPHTAVSCDAPGRHGVTHLLHTLAELAAAGVPVDPLPLFAGRDARPLTAPPAAVPGWLVNGHVVRAADGTYPPNALRPAERVPAVPRPSEAAVLEYLRAGRELIAAQREVILRHLGAIPPAPVPAPRLAETPSAHEETPAESEPTTAEAPAPAQDRVAADSKPTGNGASPLNVPPAATASPRPDTRGTVAAQCDSAPDDASPPASDSVQGEMDAPAQGRVTARGDSLSEDASLPVGESAGHEVGASAHGSVVAWGDSVSDDASTPVCESAGGDVGAPAEGRVAAQSDPVSEGVSLPVGESAGHEVGASAQGRVTAQSDPVSDDASPLVDESAEREVGASAEEIVQGEACVAEGDVPSVRVLSAASAVERASEGEADGDGEPAPPEADASLPNGDSPQPAVGSAQALDEVPARERRNGRQGGRRRRGDTQVWPRVENGNGAQGGVARHVLRVVDLEALPIPPESGTVFAGRRFLVVDDGCGVALELADMLERQGAQVRTPRDVDGPCDGLIHLGALRPAAAGVLPQAYEGIRNALAGGLRWLVVASGAGGRFGERFSGGGIGDPRPGAGLRGLARTVAQEYPEVLVRALDVDTKDTPRAIAQRILAELLDADAPVVVGHEGGVRHGLSVEPAELAGEPVVPLGQDGVVLVTGGARGIAARVALELARTSGCHVEVMGRTPEPVGEPEFQDALDEVGLRRALVAAGRTVEIEATIRRILAERVVRRNLEALRGHAASVRYHAGDVRDSQTVRDVVGDVRRRHGRLDGIVHGAGLVDERLMHDKTPDSFERVYRTKVDGACALAQAAGPGVGFFAVLGGIAGVEGARGQSDHAAASDACATLAHVWRTRLRGRVLVADWAPAGNGAGRGDPDAGAAALLREIAHGDEMHVVFTGTVR
ncbi:SDR family NAD(P)-dependent oxidoreductase [Actinomadura welshii]